ncbi:MAG: hypothetical protein R3B06_28885 [Kofleriaceae bacterium]
MDASALSRAGLCAALIAGGACTELSTGPDLSGVWQVTSYTAAGAGCGPGADVGGLPYIEFSRETIAGQVFYQWARCTSATACEAANPLEDLQYARAVVGGYAAAQYGGSGDATSCLLTARVSTAVIGADGALSIVTEEHRDQVTGSACDAPAAQSADDAMTLPCVAVTRIIAIR